MKIHVDVHQTTNPNGWAASIARVRKVGNNEISMGESLTYPNKDVAWNSIRNEAENLDYENDEILFNRKPVNNYIDLENKVNGL